MSDRTRGVEEDAPDLSASWPGLTPISEPEFRRFQALIHREAGIYLSEAKRALVEGRLARRLRELDLGFGAYYRLVESDEQERVRMLDCICTNETRFFREPNQFRFLESRVFPEWQARAEAGRRPRRVRVWSAGCSTGEEPSSLAMSFLARFPPSSGWAIDILATDLSARALEKARAAVWSLERSREIPDSYLKAFMLKGTGPQEGRMKAGPEIRAVVRFERLNLNAESLSLADGFDLILCRNVLIYFDAQSRARVITRLMERLDAYGYLFLGHAETVAGLNARLRSAGPTIYVHANRPLE